MIVRVITALWLVGVVIDSRNSNGEPELELDEIPLTNALVTRVGVSDTGLSKLIDSCWLFGPQPPTKALSIIRLPNSRSLRFSAMKLMVSLDHCPNLQGVLTWKLMEFRFDGDGLART